MTYPLFTFTAKTQDQIRDDFLRTYSNLLIQAGVPSPNVAPGSDAYILATAFAGELAVAQANSVLKADELHPDTAVDTSLLRWLTLFGLGFRPAIGSSGLVTINASVSGSILIPVGQQLLDGAGLRYQVTVGGLYGNNSQVPVAAIDLGSSTNHANGDTLKWISSPPFCGPTVAVGIPGGTTGLTGGSDVEDNETARARLFALLQNFPGTGNWQQVIQFGQAASPYVQMVFVYPAIQGGATLHFAVVQAAATTAPLISTSKNRDVNLVTLNNTIVPYVQGLMPTYVYVVGTTVTNVPTDAAILLSLPSASTASPPGPGGGWLDGTPWPSSIGGTTAVSVSSVTSTTQFTVTATTPPIAGASHIAFLDPTTWTVNTATVTAVSGSSGSYVITIDTPWPNIATGNFIWPQSVNQQNYVNALLGAFALMGPGEKSSNGGAGTSGVLQRAFRHPVPQLTWPYSLGTYQLKALTNSGTEVLDAEWIYRSTTTPAVPATVTSAPNILVPRNLAFYAS